MLEVDDLHLQALVQRLDVLDATCLGLESPEDPLREELAHARLHEDDVAELASAGPTHQVAPRVPETHPGVCIVVFYLINAFFSNSS